MKKLIALLFSLAPSLAFAQTPIYNINDVSRKLTDIGSTIVILLISFAVIYIIYHTVRYLIAGGDPEVRKAAGMSILWGVVGLFVILSIWGLVRILTESFKTNTNVPVEKFPQVIPAPVVR